MLSHLKQFYDRQPEPNRSCFLAIRQIILSANELLTEEYKYGLPFFYYKGRGLCYLWQDKKTRIPYIGFADGGLIDHPMLIKGDRKRMKILEVNPTEDIDVNLIQSILKLAIQLRS